MRFRRCWLASTCLCLVAGSGASGRDVPNDILNDPGIVPNASFEKGATSPEGWKLEKGKGEWIEQGHTGQRAVGVMGDGKDTSYWRTTDLKLTPQTAYRCTLYSRSKEGTHGGCVIVGPVSNNRDFQHSKEWRKRSFVFVTPKNTEGVYFRCGQWHIPGTVYFDDVCLRPVIPVYARQNGRTLGAGEETADGRYIFAPRMGGEGSNESRCLVSHNAGFNSYRWVFGPGKTVVYRLGVDGVPQKSAKFRTSIGYHQSGKLFIDASKDGKTWRTVGQVYGKTSKDIELPDDLFPAIHIWIRMRASEGTDTGGDSAPGSFQVYSCRYEAALAEQVPDAVGSTSYVDVIRPAKGVDIAIDRITKPGAEATSIAGKISVAEVAGPVELQLTVQTEDSEAARDIPVGKFRPGKDQSFNADFALTEVGTSSLILSAWDGEGKPRYVARTQMELPILYAADYGYAIGEDPGAAIWWCEGTHKVSKMRPAPRRAKRPVALMAAGNEYEPFQLVIRPNKALANVRVDVSDLTGPAGSKITSKNVTVDRVAYVHVERPTDRVGCEGDWPDALPPVDGPFNAKPGENCPLWITVKVPPQTKAGGYKGTVTITADGGVKWKVPLSLRVLGFTLPKESHVFATFGFRPGEVRRYHNIKDDATYAKVYDLYMKNFAEHRISPYDPMAMSPYTLSVETGLAWNGGKRVKDTKASGEQSLKIVDKDTRADAGVHAADVIPIDPKAEYVLKWKVHTEKPDQPYMLTVQQYDAKKAWLAYHNIDIRRKGKGTWESCEQKIRFRGPKKAHYVGIVLRAAWWDEKGRTTGTAWFDDISLRRADGGPELVQDPGFEKPTTAMKVNLDFSAFDKAAAKYLDGMGFTSFRLRVTGLGGGTFHSRHKGSIGGFAQGTPEYDDLMGKYLGQLEAHLREKGWLDEAYVYWFDEPSPKDYEFVKNGMATLDRCGPGLTRMLTEQIEPELIGSVDLWCPLTASYDEKLCKERQQKGEHIMWYVCTGPKAPYATLFIDHPAVDFRIWLWQTYQYDVEGILIWTSNYWTSSAAYPGKDYQRV